MKFTATLLVLLGAAMATATTEPAANAADDCSTQGGLLNVPQGITNHRKCAAHPLSGLHSSPNVHKRACASRSYGCEKKFCWKKCGSNSGSWCWQAWNFGSGDWVKCSKDSDCEPAKLSRADCSVCNDSSCGCSC